MNEQNEQDTATLEPGPRKFLRTPDDRFIGGVCGGLGRYFRVDPVLFRVAAVVLVFVGGVALLAYLALWAVVPTDDGTGKASRPAPLMRLLGGADGRVKAGRVAAIVGIVIGGFILAGLLTVGAVWATGSGGGVWVAVVVILLGLVAVAGALTGRRKAAWVLVPALWIAALGGLVAAADVRFDGGIGEKNYRPIETSALPAHGYKLAAGHMRIDLRDLRLAPGTITQLPVQVGMGATTIIVPSSVCVQSASKVGAGYIDVLGDDEGGFDVHRDLEGARGRAPRVQLRAKVGMGALEVVHRPQDSQLDDHGPGWRGHNHGNRPFENTACEAPA